MKSANTKAIEILEKHKKVVWPEIKSYLKDPTYPKAFIIPKKFKAVANKHWVMVNDYPERKGKYIRPTLLLLTTKAMGAVQTKAVKTAAAMQISEDWILNHDDIQDNSPLRRGKPSLHKIHGIELAMNAGDALHSIMWKVLIDNLNLLDTKKTTEIMDEFYKIILRTTLGQTIELDWMLKNKPSVTSDEYYLISDSKVCYYTIAAPMRLGAIIANASKAQLEVLSEFGIYLGRCFQLVDDILDVTSDFSGLKQMGNDIYEGKRTLILGHLLRRANKTDKKKIVAIMNKSREEKTEKEVAWVIEKMNTYGSIEYARKKAEFFKEKAEKMLEKDLKFLSRQPDRDELKEIIRFILERKH